MVLVLSASPGACQQTQISQKVDSSPLAAILLELRKTGRPDDFTAPEGASALLVSLRDQVRSTIEARLAEASTSESVEQLRARLQGAMGGMPEPGGEDRLGEVPLVMVRRHEGHPGILLVTADYPTLCGRTTSLFLFRAYKSKWWLSWAREPGNLLQKDPGQENLEVILSGTRPDGSFYLATCSNPPWCTSCWSVLKLTIVHFDAGGGFKETALSKEMGFYRCDERNVPHLQSTKAGFTVRYKAMSSDPGLWGRQVRIRLATSDSGIRMEPMAGLRPDETIDLWKDLDAGEALQWSEGSEWAGLKPFHARLHKHVTGAFLFTKREKGGSKRVLVAFEPDGVDGETSGKQVWYFTLTMRGGIYRVASISEEPPAGFGEEEPARGEKDDEEDG